ncbi:protein shisa-5 isoform X2 [Drosophila busckii]|uniref:protein shisa-5 isoform X2 n=1 Tax=Drosophila busckii TaxID=30019 RepID=UPI00083EF813|nr:protein shisa-5 isoform X2 [Drosophila busckii]
MVYLYLDIWIPTLVFVIIVIFLSICIRQRRIRRMQSATLVTSAPVVVTSATHTAPGGYPVTQLPATNYQTNVYATPYPAQTTGNVTVQMPMPMPHQQMQPMPGMQTHVYPPMPMPGAGVGNMNPPTYDMAVAPGGPSVVPGYEKQSPYNPNFSQ